jgi:hypothetical protein
MSVHRTALDQQNALSQIYSANLIKLFDKRVIFDLNSTSRRLFCCSEPSRFFTIRSQAASATTRTHTLINTHNNSICFSLHPLPTFVYPLQAFSANQHLVSHLSYLC